MLNQQMMSKTYRVEEHFRAEEALVAHINFYHVVGEGLVHKPFELGRLHDLPRFVRVFLIILAKFFQDILAHVAVLLLNSGSDLIGILRGVLLSTIFHLIKNEFGDIAAGQGDALHA
jgi:hypothetical protein